MSSARPRGAGYNYGDIAPHLIGATRPPPRLTILRRDPMRVALIESMDRDSVIEAIAAHLAQTRNDRSMPRMYAAVAGSIAQ